MKISVVIPVYNAEKFILESVNSVLNQTYTNLEIICIDDCSTDNTREVLKKYNKVSPSNWWKFGNKEADEIKKVIIKNGGLWQIPIYAKKGSFIIWSSTTIHAAKLQNKEELPKPNDRF